MRSHIYHIYIKYTCKVSSILTDTLVGLDVVSQARGAKVGRVLVPGVLSQGDEATLRLRNALRN